MQIARVCGKTWLVLCRQSIQSLSVSWRSVLCAKQRLLLWLCLIDAFLPHWCAQVKSVEEQYSSHMRQLEMQLEEALQQQQQAEAAAAAAVVAAAAAAGDGSSHSTCYLPAIDTSSAAEKTLQLLDKLLLVRMVEQCSAHECRESTSELSGVDP
jgi:hypothetical protein